MVRIHFSSPDIIVGVGSVTVVYWLLTFASKGQEYRFARRLRGLSTKYSINCLFSPAANSVVLQIRGLSTASEASSARGIVLWDGQISHR